MGCWEILDRNAGRGRRSTGFVDKTRPILARNRRRFRQSGVSLVELTVTLCLLLGIALFGMQTMVSAWMLQKWSIEQSMTDAYAGIETAYAQRWVFASIPALPARWPTYPASATTTVTIGQTPKGPVTAQVIRTCKPPFTDPTTGAASFQDPVTGANAYLLESYVVYQDGQRNYCKVSKVYRDQ